MSSRCSRGRVVSHARRLAQLPLCELISVFGAWISLPDRYFRPLRDRTYTPERTFWLFLYQVLSERRVCRTAVEKALAWLAATRGREASTDTAAYRQARKRLPDSGLKAVSRQIVENVENNASTRWFWRGHCVKVLDGSSLQMPDTPSNQKAWPQPSAQKPGCGFPVMRIVVMFSLATGVALQWAEGALTVCERALFRRLMKSLSPGDVALADRGFCCFIDFHNLLRQGVHSVMRQHARLKLGVGLRRLRRLGKNERLMEWVRSPVPGIGYTRNTWALLPPTLTVRQITVHIDAAGFRTQVFQVLTTLLDPKAYPAAALADLYRRRWEVELDLRHIKTTMGLEKLRCKTPAMIRKELLMHLIAYNLIRAVMMEAAGKGRVEIQRLSLAGAMAAVRAWAPHLAQTASARKRANLYRLLLSAIARDQVPNRPNRVEPRARKQRPKEYQLLNKPRHLFKDTPHRNKYQRNSMTQA